MTEQGEKGTQQRRLRGEGGVYWNKARQRYVATRVVGYDDRGVAIRKSGVGKSKSAALEALKRRVREYERGLAAGAERTTVGDAVSDWLLYGQGKADDQTVKTREYNAAHVIDGIGDILLRRLTAKHVEKLLAAQKGQSA